MEELEASLQKERETLEEEIRKNNQVMEENRSLREEMDRSAFINISLKLISGQHKQKAWMLVLY